MVPAAQYLRMSTEHQKYSLENQAAAIASYAESHGFLTIKTYADSGKSGLYLKHRAALSLLLKDVINREICYKAILVYDVSRWGRFQDADEAAHYEFICRSAGIQIHYCAETFNNDGSLSAIVMKALKRAMAREFSRELSMKTSLGKKRVAQMGFRPGGMAGFGLRRMLIAADGSRRRVLERGDYKAVATDRVILVPGPPEEIACVHDIFRMFLEGEGFAAIARKLNHEHVDCPNGEWKPYLIRDILTNPKYIGWLVWGRVEDRLTGSRRNLSIDQWIIKPDVFQPIVDKSTFLAAQHILCLSHRHQGYSLQNIKNARLASIMKRAANNAPK